MSGASPPTTTAGFKSPQEPGKNCPDIVATYESNTDDFFLLHLLIMHMHMSKQHTYQVTHHGTWYSHKDREHHAIVCAFHRLFFKYMCAVVYEHTRARVVVFNKIIDVSSPAPVNGLNGLNRDIYMCE